MDSQIDAITFYKRGIVKKLIFTGDGASNSNGDADAFITHLKEVWGNKS